MSRVVVVGAGVGGLAAAARLAALGHDVTVCEAAEDVGGKLGLHVEHVPGVGEFRFDTGPSLVTMPSVLEDLLLDTGGWPTGLELTPLEPLARYRFADGTGFDASSDPAVHREALERWSPGAGADWARLLERAGRVWEASRGPFLESPLAPADLARLALRRPRDLAVVAPHRSLRSLGREHLRDPRLRTVLERYATYSGSDPRDAPAALVSVPFVEQRYGGWYVPGGLRRIGEVLRDRARERGAVVRTGARVRAITTSGGRVDGVRLADGAAHLPADVVVANADAAHVYADLLPHPGAARRLARATPSLGGFVLLLAVRGRTPALAHHTVCFPADYDAEFDAVFGRRGPARPVADPTVYISAPDDPAVRPDGHEAWFVLVNAPRHGTGPRAVDWRTAGAGYADHVQDLLERRFPGLRERTLSRTVLTPADLEQRTGAVGGSIYGTSSNGPLAAFLRPANRSPVPGLLLVGGSSHPGGGLPLVALSAAIVAGIVGPA